MPIGPIREVFARELVGMRDAFVLRATERRHVIGRERIRTSGPERVHERQTRQPGPRAAEIDLLDARTGLEKQRVVADDERGITAGEHVVEYSGGPNPPMDGWAYRLQPRLDGEQTGAQRSEEHTAELQSHSLNSYA